jgi:hypothetical protein
MERPTGLIFDEKLQVLEVCAVGVAGFASEGQIGSQ